MKTSLLACLTLFAAACSGKSDAQNFADTYCAEVAKCCVQAGMSGSGSLCHMLSSGAYDASAGEACLADVKAQVAAGTFCTSQSTSSSCNAVFTSNTQAGHKKPGEDCEMDSDCAPSSDGTVVCASRYVDPNWLHKCQVRMPGKVGDTCLGTQDGDLFSSVGAANTGDLAASGYVCNTADSLTCSSSSGTCIALSGVGQACAYTSDCVRSAYCDGKDRCSARVAAGAACTGQGDECVAGYYCADASPRQCTPQVGTGASCTSDAMCTSDNCVDSTCKPGLGDTLGWAIFCA